MKRLALLFSLLCSGLFWGQVRAQDLELSVTAGSVPFSVNLALSNLALLSNPELSLEAAISNRRGQIGLSGALEFAPLGRATAYARFAVSFFGGVRFEAGAKGALGPVALELGGVAWSAAPSAFDASAPFAWNPDPISNSGFYLGAQGAYRLNRTLLLLVGARGGSAQSRLSARLENRSGDWTYGGGLLVAWQSNGLTYGLTATARLSPEDQPYGIEAQGFVGINEVVGFGFGGAGLIFNYAISDLGNLSAFVNYEIWRLDVLPLRFGANLELTLGPGTAFVRGFGGADLTWSFNWGISAGYRLSLESILNP